LATAQTTWPSLKSVSVWRLNEENVVNPPRIPASRNWRAVAETMTGESGPQTK
jgi:hypothetical protein